ncbi:translocase of chloroplast 159 chloroplastic [Phtheirospermum japonicum]|uniref:Translocase of chloroplast 159 chloroplastic n=1 Tax=Phtheirospermum japonicum TaxID=374723 RepID=A0A830CZ14_9LAMI|nr:translocase of chloroplast 159 chloroplastic [Phtheirospermum japonicum]
MEQSFNNGVLSSVKKLTKKSPPDVVLYVDRLDSQTCDLNDLPILKTVTNSLGPSIWRNTIVTLTHAACDPPDGTNGTPLSYEMLVAQRSHLMHQSISHAVGPGLMNPISLVENQKNGRGEKILPNGQIWRPQLLLLCYSMKILSEAGSIFKSDRKLLDFRARSPPLPYMLSSMLQARPHPKMDDVDSDIDLDELSETDEEQEDEYDGLPPFKPLKKAQIGKLTREQKHAYFEEYDYRVKLLQKKQWREELRRMREIKKDSIDLSDVDAGDDDGAAPVAVPLPDMALPPSFDGDSPAYRYRFLEPGSRFLARPVLDSHGWDHDCGYDGVNLEHALAVNNRFPVSYTVQITKDKKDFNFSLDSSISAKHGKDTSSMVGLDIHSMGKQIAYTVRGETKIKKFRRNKAGGGVFLTFLGENVVPGLKIEDRVTLGKRYVLVGSGGAVGSGKETAYGANIEVQRRESDYPIGEVESTLGVSMVKWRGDWTLGINGLAQFSIGHNSKVGVRAGINNKLSGQISVKTSSSENLALALAAVVPAVISVYKKLWPGADETYSIY